MSVAALVDLDEDGKMLEVRVALGGLAHKPWRATKAEHELTGKKLNDTVLRKSADAELHDAQGYEHNTFKIELAKRCIVRAVKTAAAVKA